MRIAIVGASGAGRIVLFRGRGRGGRLCARRQPGRRGGAGRPKAAHAKGLAKISVHIRGRKALEQIAQTPPGSTAFLVLGTNDANGSIARLDKSIDDIVSAAEKKNITLVWMGPPCVRKSWDTRARELDVILREKLASTSVRYVSMRDDAMCSGAFHEPDGVHLKMKGYVHMWEKASSAAGLHGRLGRSERRTRPAPFRRARPRRKRPRASRSAAAAAAPG